MILTKKQQKHQQYCQAKLININILQMKKKTICSKQKYLTDEKKKPSALSRIIEQAKSTYSPVGKAFEKQIKTIE